MRAYGGGGLNTIQMLLATGMGDRLRESVLSLYVTSHPGQLGFLSSVGQESGVKAGWLITFVDKRVGGSNYCVIYR